MTSQEVKEAVIKVMNSQEFFFKEFDKIQKPKVWYVILVNGKRIQLSSGKNSWNGLGAAKTALKYAIRSKLFRIRNKLGVMNDDGTRDYMATNAAFNGAIDEWIDKHVAFVPFDDYMKSRKKRK